VTEITTLQGGSFPEYGFINFLRVTDNYFLGSVLQSYKSHILFVQLVPSLCTGINPYPLAVGHTCIEV
jgi:hypothetical protein